MKVKTNNQWREIIYKCDETDTDNELDSGFYYKKQWYSLSDFMRTENNTDWHEVHHYTYDSGLLIKISPYGDAVIVGRF